MKKDKRYTIAASLIFLFGCSVDNKSSISEIEKANPEGKVNIHIFQAIQKEYFANNRRFANSFNELSYPVWKGNRSSNTLDYKYILISEDKSKWTTLIAMPNNKQKSSYVGAVFSERSTSIFKTLNCIGLPNKFNDTISSELLKSIEHSISLEHCPSEFNLAPP